MRGSVSTQLYVTVADTNLSELCTEKTISYEDTGPILPARDLIQEAVRGERSVLHFTRQNLDGNLVVSSLVVEVVDPSLPGHARRFCLSHLCPKGNECSPGTMRQIVDAAHSEDCRLDALKTLVVDICQIAPRAIHHESAFRGAHLYELPAKRSVAGSPCRIVPVLNTGLEHLFEGAQSRIFRVYRGEQHLVDFTVNDRAGRIRDVNLRIIPAHLDLPLLDARGIPVNERTVNSAIDDFYAIVRQNDAQSLRQTLGALTHELDLRRALALRNRSPGADVTVPVEFFYSGQLQSSLDRLDKLSSFERPARVTLSCPQEIDPGANWESRDVGRGRSVWFGFRAGNRREQRSQLHCAGFTDYQIPFRISFECPKRFSSSVTAIWKTLTRDGAAPAVVAPILELTSLPGAAVRYDVSADPGVYPEQINGFVERIRSRFGVESIGRGMLVGFDPRKTIPAAKTVYELVREGGGVPIWGTIRADSVAHCWSFQAFVDAQMQGRVFLVNPLGARISLKFLDWVSNRDTLASTLELFYEKPDQVSSFLRELRGVIAVYEGFPGANNMKAYRELTAVANSLRRALETYQFYDEDVLARYASWKVSFLPGSRCALSISARSVDGHDDVPVFTFVVNQHGLEAFLVSMGERSLLGQLLGTLLEPQNGESFDPGELNGIVDFICGLPQGAKRSFALWKLWHYLPSAVRTTATHMWQFDPRREEYDRVMLAIRWLEKLLGWGRYP